MKDSLLFCSADLFGEVRIDGTLRPFNNEMDYGQAVRF
jgi:hypothetical protein